MGFCRGGGLRMPAALDHDDRFDAGGGAGRRHEFARVLDQLDVEQNRPGASVNSEVIKQIT